MSDVLCSTYYPSIDTKGRMNFPSKLREVLGPEFYLCIGHDNYYIAVYSPEEFEAYREKINAIPGVQGSNLKRHLFSGADKQVPDKQGRIFIAPHLREYAKLGDEIVVIGSVNRVEIWDKKRWKEFDEMFTPDEVSKMLDGVSI